MCSRFEQNGQAIRPTDRAAVLTAGGPKFLRWGLAVTWDSKPLINARAETLEHKPTFRRLLVNRLAVPAGCWWEWQGKRKFRLGLADGQDMRFAGLFDGEDFVIVTRAAAPSLAHVHERMPVAMTGEQAGVWLDGGMDISALLAVPALEYRAQACDPSPAQGELF